LPNSHRNAFRLKKLKFFRIIELIESTASGANRLLGVSAARNRGFANALSSKGKKDFMLYRGQSQETCRYFAFFPNTKIERNFVVIHEFSKTSIAAVWRETHR
jgi:hypothetical protein